MNSNAEELISLASWGDLQASSGNARSVPNALRALADAKTSEEAESAYWRLDNVVVIQGSVFESALTVVPVLLAILGGELSDASRVGVLDLLFEIQNPDVHPQQVQQSESHLADDCTAAVEEGLWLYWACLLSPDALVRRTATDLVGRLESNSERRMVALTRGLVDTDPRVQKSARWWIDNPPQGNLPNDVWPGKIYHGL